MTATEPPSTGARFREVRLGRFEEPRGTLCFAEVGQHVDFPLQRAFWISGVPAWGERGHHAHRSQHELVIAAAGSFVVRCDDGAHQADHRLDSPSVGLVLEPMVFHHLFDFTPGSLCLVLSSGPYLRAEYLTDPDEFRRLMSG